MTIILGLTGSIATGKSTASSLFKEFGFPIISADSIARKVVEPGKPGLDDLVIAFGTEILTSDGKLNREKLGKIIFNDSSKRRLLNRTLSKYIKKEILQDIDIKRKNAPLVVVDIPLLYEEGYDQYVDQIAVVYIPENIQLRRLMKRDKLSEKEAYAKMNSQWPIEKKREVAQIVFDNQGDRNNLKKIIKKWLSDKSLI